MSKPTAAINQHTESATSVERVPNVFATLMICLPSAHEGGMLELLHDGVITRSSTEKQPAYGAWCSDVVNEVKEVTAGYRLVLTYNLVLQTPNVHFSAAALGRLLAPVGRALDRWTSACSDEHCGDPAVFMLEHKYTDTSICLRTLKGADLARVKAVHHFARQKNLVVCLASMERYVQGEADASDASDEFDEYDEDEYYAYGRRKKRRGSDRADNWNKPLPLDDGRHAINEIIDSTLRLEQVVDLNGSQIANEIHIEEEIILQRVPFDGRDPDEEDYDGDTGYGGGRATCTHWYRDTVWRRVVIDTLENRC